MLLVLNYPRTLLYIFWMMTLKFVWSIGIEKFGLWSNCCQENGCMGLAPSTRFIVGAPSPKLNSKINRKNSILLTRGVKYFKTS